MLPVFRYHPDPVATGMIVATEKQCQACGQSRGYTYGKRMYSRLEIETVCPWYIADGTAARMFDGTFVDDHSLGRAGVPAEVIEEVCCRTPGYISWQGEEWQVCCEDACEFHGDETSEYLHSLTQDEVSALAERIRFPFDVLMSIIPTYQPGGSPALYRFRCRHCSAIRHHADMD